jgi:ABC-2 type transport system permease protein
MHLFFQLAKRSFQRQLAYRAAALAGLVTNGFFGMLRAAVLVALFGSRTQVEGISLQDAITYTGLTQALIAFISMFGWYDLMHTISTGEVGSDLLKPVGFYSYWLARDLGRAVSQLLLRGLPLVAGYAVFYRITVPDSLIQWTSFLAALLLAWWVSFSWRFLVNLAAFWTPNAVGIGRLAFMLSWILSGFMMPLRFFPDWFQRLCYLTPFPHTINSVVEVYLGLLEPSQLIAALVAQGAWIAGLWVASQLLLYTGVRRLVIQGG